ncbi:MAG: FecR family protein [Bacteroidales bacterium]
MEQEKLIRFIAGQSSASEQKEIMSWIEQSPDHKKTFAQLKNMNVAVDLLAEEGGTVKISKPVKLSVKLKPIFTWGAKVAAVIVIGLSIFYWGRQDEKAKWVKSAGAQFTEIKVPMGESVSIHLPDGSSVKLNSGSVLKFSKLFGHENRQLSLNGEGYFKVKKNDKRFIVKTSDINLEVLGTTFNVSAYDVDNTVTASLYKGKVKVYNKVIREAVILNPDDSYVFDKITKESTVRGFNKEHGWTNNYFVANRDDIELFVKKIERKYNVKIVVAPELRGKCRYTGVFKGESLNEILQNMALASPITYEINNNAVFIKYKKKKR